MEPRRQPLSFQRWFEGRFREVCGEFEGRLYTMDPADQRHDEANSLKKSRIRFRDTLRLIWPELETPGDRRFLDVGGGHIGWFVAPRFPGRTEALDLGGAFRAESGRLGVPMRIWDILAGEPPYAPETFDMVSFTEVLEHLPPPPFAHVRRVASLVKPGGLLLFSVPNLATFWKRWKFLLFGRSPLKLGERHHALAGIPDHIREYTIGEVQRILAACGLEIEHIRTGFYGHGLARRALTPLCRLAPSWGRTILVRARKLGSVHRPDAVPPPRARPGSRPFAPSPCGEAAAWRARCRGQWPSISSCSVMLRNVRMSTMQARTARDCRVGSTATVRMMPPAMRNSSPRRIPRLSSYRCAW